MGEKLSAFLWAALWAIVGALVVGVGLPLLGYARFHGWL